MDRKNVLFVGGNLKKSKVQMFLNIVSKECGKVISQKKFNEILHEKHFVPTPSWYLSRVESGGLMIDTQYSSLIDLKEFLVENNLTYGIEETETSYLEAGGEYTNYSLYQWEPGLPYETYTQTNSLFEPLVSSVNITNLLQIANSCKNKDDVPLLVNAPETHQEFVKRRLKGEDVLDILTSEINKIITPVLIIPPFKIV